MAAQGSRLTRAHAKLERDWYNNKNQQSTPTEILEEYQQWCLKAKDEVMIQIPGAGLHNIHEAIYEGKRYPAIVCHNIETSFSSLNFPHIPAIGYTSDNLEDIFVKAPVYLKNTLLESLQDSDTLFSEPSMSVSLPSFLIPEKEKEDMVAWVAFVEMSFHKSVRLGSSEFSRISTSQLSAAGLCTADLPSLIAAASQT